MTLRCVTYLAAAEGEPGLPLSLFEEITEYVASALGVSASLEAGCCGSGPREADDDRFATGDVDLGWVCAPSMLWLHARASIDLLPASMVLDDPRCEGRATYVCEVVVRRSQGVSRFEQLRGTVAAYNDRASLSGFGSLLGRVQSLGGAGFFARWHETGSHARSVAALREGRVDVAVIDANVWKTMPRCDDLVVLETLGPFPIQPMVVRRGWPQRVRVAEALRAWRPRGPGPLRGFASVSVSEIRAGVPWPAIRSAWSTSALPVG